MKTLLNEPWILKLSACHIIKKCVKILNHIIKKRIKNSAERTMGVLNHTIKKHLLSDYAQVRSGEACTSQAPMTLCYAYVNEMQLRIFASMCCL